MSSLRDARLQKALAHAPDAGEAAPAAAVRDAVRAAAHRAVAAPPREPWWKGWFAASPARPWNAAFASLLIAGVVTLLWRGGEELPQEPGMTSLPAAPVAAPAPAPAPAPAAREKASEPALAKTTVQPAPPAAKPAQPPRAAAQTAGPAKERETADAVAERRDATERKAEVVAPAAAPQATAPAAAPAPAAPAMAAPMPARRAESAAPAPQAATAASYAYSFKWDTVRIAAAQREVTVPHDQASALSGAILELLVAGSSPANPSNTVLQITLTDQGRTAAELTLGETTFTWQLAGGPAQTWRADPARLARARADAMRLLVPR